MTMLLTFDPIDPRGATRLRATLAIIAAALMTGALPTSACDKAPATLVASTTSAVAAGPVAPQATGVFSGQFVNGVPVYRLPSIEVVGRRPAEVAKTQRSKGDAALKPG